MVAINFQKVQRYDDGLDEKKDGCFFKGDCDLPARRKEKREKKVRVDCLFGLSLKCM